jgi:hypothetical protein
MKLWEGDRRLFYRSMVMYVASILAGALFLAVMWGVFVPDFVDMFDRVAHPETVAETGRALSERMGAENLLRLRVGAALIGALIGGWAGSVWNFFSVRQRYFNAFDPDTYPTDGRYYDDPSDRWERWDE